MQLIPHKKINIKTCSIQFLWFFRLKCLLKGHIISRIQLSRPNAYKLMCFDRNFNGNGNVKLYEWDNWSLHRRKNLTLATFLSYYNVFKVHIAVQRCLDYYLTRSKHRHPLCINRASILFHLRKNVNKNL